MIAPASKKGYQKRIWLCIMAACYIAAGINHFAHPVTYEKIIPPVLPFPRALVYTSGIIEIVLGILIVPVATRKIAAWGIILLLIAVFPANIQMMINYRNEGNQHLWITMVRLPLQLLLIYWAYKYSQSRFELVQKTDINKRAAN